MNAINVVIRYGGIVVLSQKLEPGEYTLGRGRHNKLRLHLAMLSRQHGKIWFAEGDWWYQDLRPSAGTGRVQLSQAAVIALGNNVELGRTEGLEEEATRSDHISEIREAVRAARGGLSRKGKIGVAAGFAATVGAAASGYVFWKSRQPMDATELLAFVKPKIVEFEFPRESKGQQDLRKYAGLKDEDFTDTLGFCTGFIVGKNVMLTANHCLQGTAPFGVTGDFVLKTHDGKTHKPGTILGFDTKRDFAYVEVPGLEAYGQLDISEQFVVGEKVFTVGNVAGEGVAIRDGVMASKTPDQDDPSVEFLRYSAAASPGNSGGPLLNGFGKVVALVFARASLSENYNLGTSGKDLVAGRKRFVDDRSPKTVVVKVQDLMQFRPESLFYHLRIPFESAWRENPESMRPLEQIQAEITVPASPEDFTKNAVEAIDKATAAAVEAVALHESNAKARTQKWESFLTDRNKIIIPGQFGEDMMEPFELASDKKQLKAGVSLLTPPVGFGFFGMSFGGRGGDEDEDPKPFAAEAIQTRPVGGKAKAADGLGDLEGAVAALAALAEAAEKGVMPAAAKVTEDDEAPAKPDDEEAAEKAAEAAPEAIAAADGKPATDEMRYTSEYFEDGKRPLTMFAYRPVINVRTFAKPPTGTWDVARVFDPKDILRTIVGKDGLLAPTESQYVRPKAQREFSIKQLDEELKEEQMVDGLGRTWKVYSTELFDNYVLENYCLPLPQGGMCLTSIAMNASPALMQASRANFAKHTLTPYLVGPTFWSVDALSDYHKKKHAANDPVMKDFRLAKTKSGALKVQLKTFGVEFVHKAEEKPTMLRLTGGLFLNGDKKEWVATGVQAYYGEGAKKKICDTGLEVKGTNSVASLYNARRKEMFMKAFAGGKDAKKPKIAEIELPKDKIYTESVKTKAGVDATLYGYCMPLDKGDADGELLEISRFEVIAQKPEYKIL